LGALAFGDGVFDRFLVPLVADAVFARAFLALTLVREDGFLRGDFFAATLADFFFDVAIGSAISPRGVGERKARSGLALTLPCPRGRRWSGPPATLA
jgi:hypothetical protein